ncbi:unnamed protein product [Caenorhabditis nigoni]
MKDSETFLKNVYNTHAPHYNTIRNWFHRFEKDDFSLDEKDRSGRPRELDLDKLKHALQSDPFQSSRELAVTFGVHHSTVLEANLDRRVDDSITLLTLHAGDRWLDRLITGDEKWVFYDNHHRKPQWVGEGESPQDVPKPDLHPKKVMLSVWWGVDGPIYWELLPEGKTITGDLYTTQLRRAVEAALKQYFASRPAGFYRNGIHKLRERWRHVVDNDLQCN